MTDLTNFTKITACQHGTSKQKVKNKNKTKTNVMEEVDVYVCVCMTNSIMCVWTYCVCLCVGRALPTLCFGFAGEQSLRPAGATPTVPFWMSVEEDRLPASRFLELLPSGSLFSFSGFEGSIFT